MLKAETVVLDYKKPLNELEFEIDARLTKKEFNFSIDFKRFRDLPMVYIKNLVAKYVTEGGVAYRQRHALWRRPA